MLCYFISKFQVSQSTISILHVSIGRFWRHFQRRKATEGKRFTLLIIPKATKFVLLSVATLVKTICRRIFLKSRPKSSKGPLPVDVHRSKTPLNRIRHFKNEKETGFG